MENWLKKYVKAEWKSHDEIVYCKDCKEQVDTEIDTDDGEVRCFVCGGTEILSTEKNIKGICTQCGEEYDEPPDGNCSHCWEDGTIVYGDDMDELMPQHQDDVFEAVERAYGTTGNMMCVGWILPDGSLINTCSGMAPGRDVDHRDMTSLMGKFKDGIDDSTDAMNKFIEMGAIRAKPGTAGSSIQIATPPTASQIDAVDTFFDGVRGPYGIQFGFEIRDFVHVDESWEASSELKKKYWAGYAESELPAIALAESMIGSMTKYAISLPRGYFDGLTVALESIKDGFVRVASAAIKVGGDAADVAEAMEDYIYDQLAKRMGFQDVEVIESFGSGRTASVTVFNPQTDDASEITLNVAKKAAGNVTVDDVIHIIDTSDVLRRVASTIKTAGISVKKIVRQRKYKHGYIIRDEFWALNPDDPEEEWALMKRQAYTPCGEYIGDSKTAYFLCKTKGVIPRLADPEHCVCSIGYNPVQKKWYGWSHRAMHGFGIGDKPDSKEKDDAKIETMEEAMEAAIAFAASVS